MRESEYSMAARPPINDMLKAFADETRMRILHLLTRGKLCVCDIHDTLKLPQSKVSRHLSSLRKAGLVEVRRAGLWKHYKLSAPKGKFHQGLIGCLKSCFEEAPILKRDKAVLEKRRQSSQCRGGKQ